ncbi:MAG: cardiolipin synthase [Candidatus Syntrophosphaera sp.]|nr:cardiolipin synthase [Candidatus Syntrophosphaera sp.]
MLKVVNFIFGITIVLIIVVLVLENDDPVRTLAWILLLLYIPIIGFILYLFFGRNWRKTRLFNRKELADKDHLDRIFREYLGSLELNAGSDLQQKLCRLLDTNSKAILTKKNSVEIVSDTNAALNDICAAIENAKKHVHLEYFSIANDETGNRVKDLLIRKARQGVEVRFIYDDVGSWSLGYKFKSELRSAGVMFKPFMPVWLPILNSRLNYRNHRKLVIVDGERGFLGGLNIGDKYMGKNKYFGYWRDSLVKLRGDSVTALQADFCLDWYFVSKQNLLSEEAFRQFLPEARMKVEGSPDIPVQIAASGPDSDHASILQVFFSAISNAKRSIRITSPYLILNSSLLMALKTAAFSGVNIQIILPGRADHFIVWWGSKSYYRELLEAGIEIYEYRSGFMHAKVLIVDEEVLSIGTVNMDLRSFNQNFEITAMVYDAGTAIQAITQFEIDRGQSLQIDLEEFQNRSVVKKALESLCRLFSPLL